ncbi:MAG: stage III sporulation protein AF [Bacillota bacterium]|nr:stage III sporulation protein AF [Bacillota bacterium]
MSALKDWVFVICCVSIIGAFAEMIVPGGKTERTVKFLISLFVLLGVLSPLKGLTHDFRFNGKIETNAAMNTDSAQDAAKSALEESIRAKLSDYIKNKTGQDVKVLKIYTLKDEQGNMNVIRVDVAGVIPKEVQALIYEQLGSNVKIIKG